MELINLEVSQLELVEFVILAFGLIAFSILVRRLVRYLWSDSSRYNRIIRILPILEIMVGLIFFISAVHAIFRDKPMYFLIVFASVLAILVWAARFAIKDIIGGAILKAEEDYHVNDRIRFSNTEGWITKVGLRSLQITADKGLQLRIPYSLITGDILWKMNSPGSSAIYTFKMEVPKSVILPKMIEQIRCCILNSAWSSVVKEPRIKYTSENPNCYFVEITIHALTSDYFPNIENKVRQLIPDN